VRASPVVSGRYLEPAQDVLDAEAAALHSACAGCRPGQGASERALDSASGSVAARQREFVQSWREEMAGIEFNPDATWVSGIRGVYEDAVYGEIRICPRGGVTVFDAGPWQSTIGRRVSRDSAETLVLTSPPWLHIPGFAVVTAGGKPRLRMDNLPAPIEFTRVRACDGGR
jgi:hypothetical protein